MFHVIVNPTSSSGRGKSQWDKTEALFKNSGVPYKVYFSSAQNKVEDICEDLTSRGEECRLIILGGDGTMNAVVNGIRDFEKTKVGFIQTGSGNDLIKGLGIKKTREELIETILKGETVRTCDIGRITYHNRSSILDAFTHKPVTGRTGYSPLSDESDNTRLFNISAGIGFDAAVCRQADGSFLKTILGRIRMGKLVYISEAIHMILASPMVGMKITCDGKDTYRPRTLFAVVMNTCYEGGGFKFCPDAVNSDGVLNLFGAGNLNRMNFFRIFPTAYDGKHLGFKGLFTDRGKSFTISSAIPLWVHTDGEVLCKSSKITIDLYPHKLQLMM
ncbi:MAG: diacylglycerol kinase family lipid kinase [Lachnospiraceae bacterium]|nr:diacylglycerol kinase family lipid kinase [Lachnospiraceae bacterium]